MEDQAITDSPVSKKSSHKTETQGILRVDLSKPRRSSGGSVDFRVPGHGGIMVEPPSPQPSIDRLSVTFRDRSDCSDTSVTVNVFDPGSPPAVTRDMVTFTEDTPDPGEDEDDYSMSVTQILNRRESTKRGSQRRRKRRPSSPFSVQESDIDTRRRSSVFTNSSVETAGSAEDGTGQEQIFENIRLHKEVLSSVKLQPWSMRRKIKLVKQAKKYVKKHEGELQERLAQSRSTKDILARFNILLVKNLQYCRRELANMMTQLIPWELRIKEIESHFGSAVASYFTFLRWMFWVNLVIFVIIACFIMLPELLIGGRSKAPHRMQMTDEEKETANYLFTMWDFEGALKYSPIFYGYYSDDEKTGSGYRLPFAYFMTGIAVYIYSFVATLRRMAENSRMSKLSEKDDECAFTWKLFSGWDYMIGNAETAHNRVASLVLGFKEALLEETEKTKDEKNWRILGVRSLVNILVLGLLTISAYIVFVVVERSIESENSDSWWIQNEITVSLSIISLIFPIFFELLGLLEGYHPRKSLRIQLARIMVLNLLNLYTLIFSLFWKISKMVLDLQKLKQETSTAATPLSVTQCFEVEINCSTVAIAAALITTTAIPAIFTKTSMKISSYQSTSWPSSELDTSTMDTTSTAEDPSRPTFEYEDDGETTTRRYFSETSTEDFSTRTDFTTGDDFMTSEDLTTNEDFTSTETPIKEPISRSYELDRTLTRLSWLMFTKDALIGKGKNSSRSRRSSKEFPFTSTDYYKTDSTGEPLNSKPCYTMQCATVVDNSTGLLNKNSNLDDPEIKKKLSKLCWETMFGQELVKLTVMDLVLTVVSTLLVDFVRAVMVRGLNNCWCWDLEKTFPQYGDFKIAENILHLVNNQGMVWMGMFFSPGLPAINLFKLLVMMYLRSWAVLTCNVPHEVVFRASRSNNFYLALLLTMLFLCVLPVGYAIVWIEPSWHCGPFTDYSRIYHLFTDYLKRALPATFQKGLDYVASPAIVIPLLMLLVLIIYYLVSLTSSLREANNDLKIQLRRERTEERRKMFQLVDKKNRKGSGESDAFSKWKNILPDYSAQPEQKNENEKNLDVETGKKNARKEILSRLLKRAISSGTSDEENPMPEETAPISKKSPFIVKAMTIHEKSQPIKIKKEAETEKTDADRQKHDNSRRRSSSPPSSTQRSSIASDKIPVITISKTESDECILDKGKGKKSSPKKKFREAVEKEVEIYRKQKRKERLLVMKNFYGGIYGKKEKIPQDGKEESLVTATLEETKKGEE